MVLMSSHTYVLVNMLEGGVSDVIALDQPALLFSPRKATKMSP